MGQAICLGHTPKCASSPNVSPFSKKTKHQRLVKTKVKENMDICVVGELQRNKVIQKNHSVLVHHRRQSCSLQRQCLSFYHW